MKRPLRQSALELAIVAFCLWQASDLVTAWRHSPFDRLGWLSFVIWLIPVFNAFARVAPWHADPAPFTLTALIAVLVGRILDLNALICVALALSFAALVPRRPGRNVWLIGALAWMPIFGWLLHGLPVGTVWTLRLVLAAVATAAGLLPGRIVRAE